MPPPGNFGPPQFADTWPNKAPPWLTTGQAERYMFTLQFASDMLMEKCYQAVAIRFPGQGDVSQIPYLMHDRGLVQGPAESNASIVGRLKIAFQTWHKAGSRVAVLEQIQAYLQNLQPGVVATLPEVAIVGGSWSTVTTWSTVYQNTPSLALAGGQPSNMTVRPGNWNWDGKNIPWRTWLVLYMALVPTGQSGSAAVIASAAASACFTNPGRNVGGVWVPATSGTPVNSPWLTVTGLAGLTSASVGDWLTLAGSSHAGNNTTAPIVQVLSSSSCVVANPAGQVDAGPLTWSIGAYPFIGPGPVWGAPGYTLGEGALSTPPVDTGSNVNGTWQPTLGGSPPSFGWGLNVSAAQIQSVRQLLGGPGAGWKSAGTWYEWIVIAFDGGRGVPGDAYSPTSTPGSGNPDGTFGPPGKLVAGTWVPTRQIASAYDCFASGTGGYKFCSVPNYG